MTNYIKQPSSRPILTTTSTANPTKAGSQTYQLRVSATAAGIIGIYTSSSTSTSEVVVQIPASTIDYIGIVPGQWYLPAANMSVTEMS